MATTNRAMDTVPSNSLQPSVTINADLLILDAAIYGLSTIEFATDANRTLTEAECDCSIMRITDSPVTLTAGRDVVFPARFPMMLVQNATAQTLTLKVSGQTGVTLAAGAESIIVAGATDVTEFAGGGGAFTGGALTSELDEAKGADIASAATTDIGAATGNFVHVTGTTTITALGTVQAGTRRVVRFAGALTLTHNATSLILPTAANITTAANDCAVFVSEGSGNWRCIGYQKADGTSLAGSGGSLTNWTEAVNTSAPNATIPVVSFTVSNGATDVDAALVAKGNGATTAHVADNATTGGNKRGTQATDWQKWRTAATQVASGTYATIAGGRGNTASNTGSSVGGGQDGLCSGAHAHIGGGLTATCSGQFGFVGAGNSCQSTAQYAATVGGNGNIASAVGSFIGGGASNAANGSYSWVVGGLWGTARNIYGVGARASGPFAALGDAQSRCATMRCSTTNATQTTLTTDGAAAGTSNQLVLPNTSAFIVKAVVVSRENATGDTQSWEVTAHIKRGANAAATSMVAAATVTAIAGATAWALAVDADTTNGCLRIRFTGEAAKTIRTVCDVYSCCEVAG